MEELLRFLATYEVGVYIIFGAVILVNIKRLIDALLMLKKSKFGLEKEVAHKRIRSSVTLLVLFFLFGISYFLIVTIAAIQYPGIARIATPVVDPLGENEEDNMLNSPGTSLDPMQITQTAVAATGCILEQLEWIQPETGTTVSGSVELIGTVNIPNMGFYKYEYKLQGEDLWTPINAGNKPIVEEPFAGQWNTEQLTPGNYLLRIVVSDNQNNLLKPCEIEVRVIPQ